MLVLNVPAMVGLLVLAEPIVALIFERGNFLPSDTASTTAALMFYTPGLVAYSAVRIAVPCFYALRNSLTPTLVSIGAVILNIVLNLILVRVMGFRGLALGTSIAALGNALVLLILLHRRLGGLEVRLILETGTKTVIAATIMGGAVWTCHAWLMDVLPGTNLVHRLIQVFGSIGVGLVVLTVSASMLKIVEWNDVRRQLSRRTKTP
jgi:putative peptidoglycan lipid II flippase